MDKAKIVQELRINKSERKALNKIDSEWNKEITVIKRLCTGRLAIEAHNRDTKINRRYWIGSRGKITEM